MPIRLRWRGEQNINRRWPPASTPTPTIPSAEDSFSGRRPLEETFPFGLPSNKNHGVVESSVSYETTTTSVSTTSVSTSSLLATSVTTPIGLVTASITTSTDTYMSWPTPSKTSYDDPDVPVDTTAPFATPVDFENTSEQNFFNKFSEGTKAAIIISIIFGFVAIVIASIWFCCGKPRRRRLKAQEALKLHRERAEAEARTNNTQRPLGSSVQDLTSRGPIDQLAMREMSMNTNSRPSIAPVQARGAVGTAAARASRHLSLRGGSGGAHDAPPKYEEVVPPAHQRLAGGMVRRGEQIQPVEEDEGAGLVADGKMPLSEIPFEDVVLNRETSNASTSSNSSLHEPGPEGGRDFHTRHAARGGDTSGHSNV